MIIQRLTRNIAAPVPAVPVDLFRIGSGLVTLGYLARLMVEARDFHSRDAIIDHALGIEIFPFTWQPLFTASAPLWIVYALLSVAALASIGFTIGFRPRTCALVSFVIVVCALRHRFLVVSVDDVIVHLFLFWLVLLPTGTTLSVVRRANLQGLRSSAQVPGAIVRLFTINIAILYLVAGLTKWSSPMWLQGDALYTVLKLRAGFFADQINLSHLPVLRFFNYATLILEPLLALLVVLPAGNRFKYFLGITLIALHVGIIASLDVPFANLACLAALPLLFRSEIAGWLQNSQPRQPIPSTPKKFAPSEWFAATVVFFIAGAMACSVTQVNWRKPTAENQILAEAAPRQTAKVVGGVEQKFFFGGLWAVGLIQQYRLLDWIDDRNFAVALTVTESPIGSTADTASRVRPGTDFVPGHMRGCLTLAYIVGATWLPVPETQLIPLRRSIHQRLARRYARSVDGDVTVTVTATLQRINPSHPSPAQAVFITSFRCTDGKVTEHEMNLDL